MNKTDILEDLNARIDNIRNEQDQYIVLGMCNAYSNVAIIEEHEYNKTISKLFKKVLGGYENGM